VALGEKGTNADLKAAALYFLRKFVSSHSAAEYQPYVKQLQPLVNKAIKNGKGRACAEALKVTGLTVNALREDASFKPFVKDIYAATLEKLTNKETDQEVKQSSVDAMALIVATFGDELKAELKNVETILLEKVANEITSLSAIKGFDLIANSPLKVDLSPVLDQLTAELINQAPKNNVRQAALVTLASLFRNYKPSKAGDALKLVPNMIGDEDAQSTAAAFTLAGTILKTSPNLASEVANTVPAILRVLKSPVCQPSVVSPAAALLTQLTQANVKNITFDSLYKELSQVALNKDVSRAVLSNTAGAVAGLVAGSSDKQKSVDKFFKDVSAADTTAKYFALETLAAMVALGADQDNKIVPLLVEQANSDDEGTRNVVGECLGRITASQPSMLATLKDSLNRSPNARVKATLLGALRFAVIEQPDSLKEVLPLALDSLKDNDLEVRRQALLIVDSTAVNRPALLTGVIAPYLEFILLETSKRAENIKIVDLGIMKHEIDAGAETRRAAFDTIEHLLDAGIHFPDLSSLAKNVTVSLKDKDEMKTLGFNAITRMAHIPATYKDLMANLEEYITVYNTTVAKPVDPKKPEDKVTYPEEVIKASMSALANLSKLPGADSNANLQKLIKAVNELSGLKDKFATAQSQTTDKVAANDEGRKALRASRN